MNEKSIENNSEILFIYDARQSNPNGDMDNENKPRMDWDTETNLVSDVRLKRYIRDYLKDYKNKEIFVMADAKDAKERKKQLDVTKKDYLDLIDIRLFGAVYAESGANTHKTGPIQFNWGYSLNKVELQETKTITSSFGSGEGIGKDYRVVYSLLAFNGSINANLAEQTKLTEEDLKLFDEAMVNSIPLSRTRSKIGQFPRFYLRIELKEKDFFLKDLREEIEFSEVNKKPRSIKEVKINIENLTKYLEKNKNKINKIFYWKEKDFNIENFEKLKNIRDIVFEELKFDE